MIKGIAIESDYPSGLSKELYYFFVKDDVQKRLWSLIYRDNKLVGIQINILEIIKYHIRKWI